MLKYSLKKRSANVADVEGEVGQTALVGRAHDAERNAVDVDGLGRLEPADDERDQVGRHLHGGREAHAPSLPDDLTRDHR